MEESKYIITLEDGTSYFANIFTEKIEESWFNNDIHSIINLNNMTYYEGVEEWTPCKEWV